MRNAEVVRSVPSCGSARNGWLQHATFVNATLAEAGAEPTTAAINALMGAYLRNGDDTRAIDAYL